MWNLKNEIKQNRNKLIHTDNKSMVANGKRVKRGKQNR